MIRCKAYFFKKICKFPYFTEQPNQVFFNLIKPVRVVGEVNLKTSLPICVDLPFY